MATDDKAVVKARQSKSASAPLASRARSTLSEIAKAAAHFACQRYMEPLNAADGQNISGGRKLRYIVFGLPKRRLSVDVQWAAIRFSVVGGR